MKYKILQYVNSRGGSVYRVKVKTAWWMPYQYLRWGNPREFSSCDLAMQDATKDCNKRLGKELHFVKVYKFELRHLRRAG